MKKFLLGLLGLLALLVLMPIMCVVLGKQALVDVWQPTLPNTSQEVKDFAMTDDGRLVVLSEGEQPIVTIYSRDKAIEKEITLEEKAEAVCVDEDKIYTAAPDKDKVRVTIYTLDGEKEEEKKITLDAQKAPISQILVKKGYVYVANRRGQVTIQSEIGPEIYLDLPSHTNFALDNAANLYFVEFDGWYLNKYDVVSQKLEKLFPLNRDAKGVYIDSKNNKIYISKVTSIASYDSQGKENLEVDLNTLECLYDNLMPKFYKTKDNLCVTINEATKQLGTITKITEKELKQLKGTKEARLPKEEVLKMMVIAPRPPLEEAVNLYNKVQDQKAVQVEYKEWPEGMSTPELGQQIATELLTGNGADILDLKMQPYSQYVANDVLLPIENLEALCPSYNPVVKEAYTQNEKTYGILLDFSTMIMDVNTPALEEMGINFDFSDYTFEEFLKLVDEVENKKPENLSNFCPFGEGGLLYYMPKIYYHDFIENNVDGNWQEGFEAFLIDLKNLRALGERASEKGGEGIFFSTSIMNYDALPMGNTFVPMPKLKSDYYPVEQCAVEFGFKNTQGIKKEKNLEFLKFVLSEEVQLKTTMGFPVNDAAREKRREEILKQDSTLAESIASIDKIMAKHNAVIRQNTGMDIVTKETSAFLNGDQELDTTINNITNALNLIKKESK